MGNNSSSTASVRQENNTTVVNKSSIKVLNETINKTITETTITASQLCSNANLLDQRFSVGNVSTQGSFTYSSTQGQNAVTNFTCALDAMVYQDVTAAMTSAITEALQKSADQSTLNNLNAAASAMTQTELGSILSPAAGADSDVNQIINTNITSQTDMNISNIVKSTVQTIYNTNVHQECVNKTVELQKGIIKNIKAKGDVNITNVQTQSQESFASCTLSLDVGNKITNTLAQVLGVTIVDDTTQSSSTEATAGATASAEAQGVGSAIGDVFGGISDAIGGMFGSITGALGDNPVVSIISAVIIIFVILIGGYMLYKRSGGGNQGYPQQQGYYPPYPQPSYYPQQPSYYPPQAYPGGPMMRGGVREMALDAGWI